MATKRDETWGRLIYSPLTDTFEACAKGPISDIAIDRPISAGCIVTGKCNLKCQYCYGDDESLPTEELSAEEWAAVFRQLRSWGLMRVDLSGGEPTIRPDILRIAVAAMEAGLSVVVSTNGMVLAKKGLSLLPPGIRLHISIDSGFSEIHEESRIRRNLLPSTGSMTEVIELAQRAVAADYRVRILTCIGRHNSHGLVELGERLALVGVGDWNISRILSAGRAQLHDKHRWEVDDSAVLEEVHTVRECYPWMRIGYSNRTKQDGYFLLVLPDGSLATQYTDGRDKVVLGRLGAMSLEDLRRHPDFDLGLHARKWVAITTEYQGDAVVVQN